MKSDNITIFALSSSKQLAGKIADQLGVGLGDCVVHHFADGEILVDGVNSTWETRLYHTVNICTCF